MLSIAGFAFSIFAIRFGFRGGPVTVVQKTDRITFGLFEVDVQAGELWKAGHKIRLAGQPFTVLTTLLAKSGEVVTRDELQRQIWGTNTTVDFERALAGAINKVREALGDSADNPRFIQTLPKRGYRFIAPVTVAVRVDTPPQPLFTKELVLPAGHIVQGDLETAGDPVHGVVEAPAAAANELIPEELVRSGPARAASRPGWFTPFPLLAAFAVAFALVASLALWLWLSQPETGPLRVEQLTRTDAISAGPPNLESLLTLATDGNRILTSVMREGRPRLSAISLSNGEVETLSLPQELVASSLADISRDGSRLLLKSQLSSASEQPLWIVPSSGGSAQRVGNVLAHDASWMPDGRSVLYANGDNLAVIRLDDGVSTQFAHLAGRAFWMRWSPDNKLLRFTLLDPVSHATGIWELSAHGGVSRRVKTPQSQPGTACCGSWTADGSAYVLQEGDNLWEMKESFRGISLTQLTNGPLRFLSPVTARSGTRIYFLGLDRPQGMQVFRTDLGFQPAPAFLADASRVDFSRDGTWVAWTDNEERLWRARASDGSDKVQLTPSYLEVFMAHWSPDGKRIAIMAREHGKVWKIYLTDADGGKPEPLLNEERNEADPGWSPDGTHLVFGREPDLMGKESGSHAIQIVDVNTLATETIPGSEGMFSPRWSPDGRWIAALSLNQKSLMLYDVLQHRWKELAQTSAADPSWSADSKVLYVHAFLAEHQPILKISVPDGEQRIVADLSSFKGRETINYFFGGVTPESNPLVQPRIGAGDLYSLDLKVR